MSVSRKHRWTQSVAVLTAVVLYVLSCGPVLWMNDHGFLPGSIRVDPEVRRYSLHIPPYVTIAYSPLYVFAVTPASKNAFRSYIDLWIVPVKTGC